MDVEALLSALRSGQLPAQARQWLIEGLEAWLHGAELEQALGLASEPMDRRDDVLRVVLRLTPGGSDTAKSAYVAECLAGDRDHVSPLAADLLNKLLESGARPPRSVRHLTRIMNGGRSAASSTENTALCPDWPVPQTGENPEEMRK